MLNNRYRSRIELRLRLYQNDAAPYGSGFAILIRDLIMELDLWFQIISIKIKKFVNILISGRSIKSILNSTKPAWIQEIVQATSIPYVGKSS
jgi:hypothetical protein